MRPFLRLLVLVSLCPTAAGAQAKALKGLDDDVIRSMADWKIPGLALAVALMPTGR